MEAKILDGKETSKEIIDALKAKFEENPTWDVSCGQRQGTLLLT